MSHPHATEPSEAKEATAHRSTSTLSVVSWNTFGAAQSLLAVLRGRGATHSHRFEHPEVLESFASVDVLCAQELWLEEAVMAFARPRHLPHRILAENRWSIWPLTIGGSGLGIASRFPVIVSEFRAYSRPHVGSERFARKGMAHARIALPLPSGLEIDVLTTHLQSGYEKDAEAVRARHLRELRAFADEVGSQERPMIVAGDLNVNGLGHVRELEYRTLMGIFEGYTDVFAAEDTVTFHPQENALARKYEPKASAQRIDYFFVRETGRTLEVLRSERFLDRDLAPHMGFGHVPASDHYGLRVTLAL